MEENNESKLEEFKSMLEDFKSSINSYTYIYNKQIHILYQLSNRNNINKLSELLQDEIILKYIIDTYQNNPFYVDGKKKYYLIITGYILGAKINGPKKLGLMVFNPYIYNKTINKLDKKGEQLYKFKTTYLYNSYLSSVFKIKSKKNLNEVLLEDTIKKINYYLNNVNISNKNFIKQNKSKKKEKVDAKNKENVDAKPGYNLNSKKNFPELTSTTTINTKVVKSQNTGVNLSNENKSGTVNRPSRSSEKSSKSKIDKYLKIINTEIKSIDNKRNKVQHNEEYTNTIRKLHKLRGKNFNKKEQKFTLKNLEKLKRELTALKKFNLKKNINNLLEVEKKKS